MIPLKRTLFILIMALYSFPLMAQSHKQERQALESASNLISDRKAEEALVLLVPLRESSFLKHRTEAFRLSGQAMLLTRDYPKAEEFLEKALELSVDLHYLDEQARSAYWLGRTNALQGQMDTAFPLAMKAAHLARSRGDIELEYEANNLLNWIYFSREEDFQVIFNIESRLFDLAQTIGSDREKAFIYNNLGYDLTILGNVPLDSTIRLMTFANQWYGQAEDHQGRWYTLMNLTWQHRLMGILDLSKEYGEKGLRQALKDDDRHAVVETCFQLAETMILLGEVEEADSIYQIGIQWRGNEEDRDRYVFDVYHANFLWVTGNREEAVSQLESAVAFLETSEVFYEMHGRALLASFYWEMKSAEQAEEQVNIISRPRHNYISTETFCLAALTRARILADQGEKDRAKELLGSWREHMNQIGAHQLVRQIEETGSTLP